MHPKATKDKALLPNSHPHNRPQGALPIWPQCPQTLQGPEVCSSPLPGPGADWPLPPPISTK